MPQSFKIVWKPPADEDRNGLITHYTVSVLNLETDASYSLNSTVTERVVSDLTPFTMYEVKVAAHTSAGRGPFTAIQNIQTQESGTLILVLHCC